MRACLAQGVQRRCHCCCFEAGVPLPLLLLLLLVHAVLGGVAPGAGRHSRQAAVQQQLAVMAGRAAAPRRRHPSWTRAAVEWQGAVPAVGAYVAPACRLLLQEAARRLLMPEGRAALAVAVLGRPRSTCAAAVLLRCAVVGARLGDEDPTL
jgi:hypothetical protein